MVSRKFTLAAALLVVLSTTLNLSKAAEGGGTPKGPTQPASPTSVTVLNTYGIWRLHCTIAPPVLASGENVTLKYAWLNYKTALPAQDWMNPDFDDRFWDRGPITLACKSPMLARVCARDKFTVTDPGSVNGLALSVTYHGGLIVYVNGKEARREHIAPGQTLAEGPAGVDCKLADFTIPPASLRKGVNVIGLEAVRAPYPAPFEEKLCGENSCQIIAVKLTCDRSAGLVPNAVRPKGLQVWNADPLAVDLDYDFGDQAEPLRPVVIPGARNGAFTGKVVVGSATSIRDLKVTPTDLRGQAGIIPAAKVRFRYGLPWGDYRQFDSHKPGFCNTPYPVWCQRLGALAEKPLSEFPVLPPASDIYTPAIRPDAAQAKPIRGAVVPLWITIKVPPETLAGLYTGRVRIEAQGENAVEVPIELHVADWLLPDTQDFRTWVDLVQCPDTLALEYNVPLWSEKHWEMIADSFKAIGETGSRTLYIPLVAHTDLGNEETMVRWIKKGDKYEYDFSIMDRYLDVAEKNMGTPKLVVLVVWDVYMIPAKDVTEAKQRQGQMAQYVQKTSGKLGGGPMVTAFDPATGRTELATLPTYFDTAASKPLWQPLIEQVLAKLRKRNLGDKLMLGMQGDAWASKEEHLFFKDLTGGLPWILQSHEGFGLNWGPMTSTNALMHGVSKIGYQARVWAVTFSDDGADRGPGYQTDTKSLRGWSRPELCAQFDRETREGSSNVFWAQLAEVAITGGQRGNGRLGADYWKVLKDNKGRRRSRSHERYPESTWRNLFICDSLLGAGPDGPVATDQLEAYREGIQECEARIVIERALADDTLKAKLGDDLLRRCDEYLQNRHNLMWLSLSSLLLSKYTRRDAKAQANEYAAGTGRWGSNINGSHFSLGSGRQLRTEQLFSLAGEVEKRLKH